MSQLHRDGGEPSATLEHPPNTHEFDPVSGHTIVSKSPLLQVDCPRVGPGARGPGVGPGPDLKGQGPGRLAVARTSDSRVKGQLVIELALRADPGLTRTGPMNKGARNIYNKYSIPEPSTT
jgi:hypothetical protein